MATFNLPYDPAPVTRDLMKRRAKKLVGLCPSCESRRPLSPDTGQCWPCDNLNNERYPDGATDRQTVALGDMCNDCAFRPGSPEGAIGSSANSPRSVVDLVVAQARTASAIFWCHKPFLAPAQEWGYDLATRELMPLKGDHWRPCAGWCKAFDKKWAVKD